MKNPYITQILDDMLKKHEEYRKIENSTAFMPFNIDYLNWSNQHHCHRFAFSHYYKHPSGDMIPDPDMEILYDSETKDMYGITYQDVLDYEQAEIGKQIKELTTFLNIWMNNVVKQQQLKLETNNALHQGS